MYCLDITVFFPQYSSILVICFEKSRDSVILMQTYTYICLLFVYISLKKEEIFIQLCMTSGIFCLRLYIHLFSMDFALLLF